MAPFRPTNINKREYPGNANVIGPTTQTSLGISTTTCSSVINVCGACQEYTLNLGCRAGGGCACPCCDVTCTCECTVCTPSIPGGMWKMNEQYESAKKGAWGPETSSNDTPICVSSSANGFTDAGPGFFDCKGFFICCGPGTAKWWVAPYCTQVYRNWFDGVQGGDAISVANDCMGSCGWFVPDITNLQNFGGCNTYWDCYTLPYWSSTCGFVPYAGCTASLIAFYGTGSNRTNHSRNVRVFRCTAT